VAFRRIVRWAVDEAGNVIGGTGYEGRVYLANTLTLATIKLDSAGTFACANPHSPNAGTQTSSSANMLTTDDTITVISSTGFAVGDLVPIDGSAGRFYGVIRTIVDPTHIQFTQTLAAMGGAATMNSGALVGGPEMTGHWQCFAQDNSDYDFTLKNLATGKEGPPEGVATLSTAGTLIFQEEGADTSTRGKLNFIGPLVTLTDNAGQNRGDVTIATPSAPVASAVGDTQSTGTTSTVAAGDHRHAREAFGAVSATAYGSAANGSATTVSHSDHQHGLSLTTAEADLSADVNITSINTFFDGPSVSLAAGTWLIIATVTLFATDSGSNLTVKLWDGTTVESSAAHQGTTTSDELHPVTVAGIVAPGGTTTYKVSVADATNTTSKIKAAATANGAGNNASHIRAVRIG
jgi:hypothetical protein